MITILQVKTKSDIEALQGLLTDYLSWAAGQAKTLFNQDADVEEMLRHTMLEINEFSPPSGRLLLARVDGEPAGMASLKQIREDACVIKRMYVRPDFRGQKIGRSLLDQLIQAAEEIGYSRILLDSANFMESAQLLYRSLGFKDVDPFPEAEMPANFHDHMAFMELVLRQ